MGLLEDVAAADLKFRLVVGPAVVTFGLVMAGTVSLTGSPDSLLAGVVLGALAAVVVGYAIATRIV